MAVLAAALLVGAMRSADPGPAWLPRGDGLRRLAVVLGATVAFVALLNVIGMTIGTVLFLVVLMRFLGPPAVAAHDRRGAGGRRPQLPRLRPLAARAAAGGPARVLIAGDGLPGQSLARLLGRADAVQPADGDLRRRHRHPDRRAARDRPAVGRRPAAAAHLRHGPDLRDHHARRALRRHDVRRHDHLGADQHAGRIRVGRHLHRRLPDGAAGARRPGPRHRRDRLVHRRHGRRRPADARVAGCWRAGRSPSGRPRRSP